MIKGTPGYMAPEQIRSESETFSPATDIYALGALLYSILTLKRPTIGSDSKKQLQNVLLGKVPDFENCSHPIPGALKAVSSKAMCLEIPSRYSSTEQLIQEIHDFQNGFATNAEDASVMTLFKLFYKRQKALCLTAIIALGIVIISLMMFISLLKENERLALQGKEQVEAVLSQLKDSEKQRYDIAMKASNYAVIVQRDEQINQNFEKAERSLENLTQLEIDNYEFWYELGRLKISRLDFKNALKCFQKTVDLGYGSFKYNQIFLGVAQDFSEITQSRKLEMEDYKELYIRMPYAQIRAYLCKVLHTSQFSTIKESTNFVRFCIDQNFGPNNAVTIVTNDTSIDIDLSVNKQLKYLEFLGGLKINKLFLQNSTISSILHFYSNDFHTINLSNSKIKSIKSISGQNVIAQNLNLDILNLSRQQCSSLELQNSKINSLDLRVPKKINNLHLQNTVIRSLKASKALSIHNLYLSHDQKGINSDEMQRLISMAQNVIYM